MLLVSIQNNIKELPVGLDGNHRNSGLAGRSSAPIQAPVTTMTLGPLTIYPGRYLIQVGDKSLSLTPTEFDLLLYLAAHQGRGVPCYGLGLEVPAPTLLYP